MFLMGILYAAFVLILWSSGVGIIFVGIIAGVLLAVQYFMSEKLVLRSTGDPGALASALEKISGSLARIPSEDLRKLSTANAFMIIPALRGNGIGKLLSTHPAVEDRVGRLRAMEREMTTGLR